MSSQYAYPLPSSMELSNIVSQWPAKEQPISAPFSYSAEVAFEFPLPSVTLLLLSQGALSAGALQITASSAVSAGLARVHVTVNYHDEAVRDVAKVGLIKRNDGESGVGIFTPVTWSGHRNTDRLHFNVKLTLPLGTPSSALYINRLATDMVNFSHHVDSLKDIVNFGQIFLKGSQGKIHIKSIDAQTISLATSNAPVEANDLIALNAVVHSSNGPILGNYRVFDSLDLRTSNGPLKATVGIGGDGTNAFKTLTMRTNNSPLESTINLIAASSGARGNFRINAANSNGPLSTQIVSSPPDAVLSLDARTTNAPACAMLPPAYEGGFILSTSNDRVDVKRLSPNDPAGQARQRVLDMKATTSHTAGSVYWDKKNLNRGGVTLKSSNGPVFILL